MVNAKEMDKMGLQNNVKSETVVTPEACLHHNTSDQAVAFNMADCVLNRLLWPRS